MFKFRSIKAALEDISLMTKVIAIPQLTLSTIFSFLIHELLHIPSRYDLHELYTFAFTSFPLTIAAVIISYNMARDKASFIPSCMIILWMAIVSSVIHSWISDVPYIPVLDLDPDGGFKKWGVFYSPVLAYRYLMYYLGQFGWLMFVQAIIIGGIAGNRIANWNKGTDG